MWYQKHRTVLFTINFKVAWKGLVISLWLESDAPEKKCHQETRMLNSLSSNNLIYPTHSSQLIFLLTWLRGAMANISDGRICSTQTSCSMLVPNLIPIQCFAECKWSGFNRQANKTQGQCHILNCEPVEPAHICNWRNSIWEGDWGNCTELLFSMPQTRSSWIVLFNIPWVIANTPNSMLSKS